MTEPIPKRDRLPEAEPPREKGWRRWMVLGIALAALFAGVTVAMLRALPGPHSPRDYMIAGGLATMVALLAFLGVYVITFRSSEAFYKRRQK